MRCGSDWARLHLRRKRPDPQPTAAQVRGEVSIRELYRAELVPSRSGSFLFDQHDIDLRVLAITRLVAEIKDASGKTKPFRALPKGPNRVSFRQQVH